MTATSSGKSTSIRNSYIDRSSGKAQYSKFRALGGKPLEDLARLGKRSMRYYACTVSPFPEEFEAWKCLEARMGDMDDDDLRNAWEKAKNNLEIKELLIKFVGVIFVGLCHD
jgi:hypothetical protein